MQQRLPRWKGCLSARAQWYLFNEDQLLPEYILHVEAREDTRTAADDM